MGLHLYSIHHSDHGLDAVERVSGAVPGLAKRLVASNENIRGAVVLSTCNRLEVYLDTDAAEHPGVARAVRDAIADGVPHADPDSIPLRARHASAVLWHLFEVGAGLDSVVVGEREIAGQLRRALKTSRREGTATYLLTESIEQALRTSRRVAHLTGLASNGRSLVSVGLDQVPRDWVASRVLLLGTGAYAGAVVAALMGRGCVDISVHSSSGRAESFARSHGVAAVTGPLAPALADADVVVTCRGVGTPILTVAGVAGAVTGRGRRVLDIIDLALARDTEEGVARLPGVRLVDLAAVQRHVPDASAAEVSRAERLVAEGIEDLIAKLRGRQLDPAVIALRDNVTAMVADEVARLPQGRPIAPDEAAHALRRLAARLIHEPTIRARRAGEEGRGEAYLVALSELYGIEAGLGYPGSTPAPVVLDPDTLDEARCPVVGFDLTDLDDGRDFARHLEAM